MLGALRRHRSHSSADSPHGHSPGSRGRARLAPVAGALALAGIAASATPAAAARLAPGERVFRDDVALTVGTGGLMHAKETIVYDFAGGTALERAFVTRTRESDTR